MAVCVTGMHRSGTSMVMQLLARVGLHVGDPCDLMPGNESNPDGHWENVRFVDLDDAVLSALGGAWDHPPLGPVPVPYPASDGWTGLRQRAVRIHRELGRRAPWGWKDPRVSLVAPFWLDIDPGLRFIVCLRNPLDVASSLRHRAHTSYELGLSLWHTYNERLLASVAPAQRIVTHYAAYFERPVAELRRVSEFAGLDVDEDVLTEAARAIKPDHRHNAVDASRLQAAGVTPARLRLYRVMCEEAGWSDPALAATAGPAPQVNAPLLELEAARRQVAMLTTVVADRDRELAEVQAASHEQAAALAAARHTQLVDGLQRHEARAGETAEQLHALHDAVAENRAWLTATMSGMRQTLGELQQTLGAMQQTFGAVQQTFGAVQQTFDAVQQTFGAVQQIASDAADVRRQAEYARLVRHVKQAVERATPPGALVAVISKGDPDLIELRGRRGLHFPQDWAGAYLGHHPRDGADALRHVHELARRGMEFLAIPLWSFWWLETYREFGEYVGRGIVIREDTCVVCRVTEAAAYRRPHSRARGRRGRKEAPDGTHTTQL